MDEKKETLTQKLIEIVEQFPDKIAIQIKEKNKYKQITYRDFFQQAQAVAHSLVKLGVKKQDRIAISLENSVEWGIIYFGILFSNAIAVPFDPQSEKSDFDYYLENSGTTIIFTSEQLSSKISNSKIKIITLNSTDTNEQKINFVDFLKLTTKRAKEKLIIPKNSSENIASILYTSGTTGKPKGVMLTHKNFHSNFTSIQQLNLFTQDNNILAILPLHHAFPFMVTFLIPLFTGATITYPSSLKQEDLLSTMQETGVTVLVGVPQLFYLFYQAIINKINHLPFYSRWLFQGLKLFSWNLRQHFNLDTGKLFFNKIHKPFGEKLNLFVCGGAKFDTDIKKYFIQLGFNIFEGYGLTETAPIVTFNSFKNFKFNSVGKSIPGVSLKIVKPNKNNVGEIAVKGLNIMEGYYKNESATKAAIKNGWFYTGDLGKFDSEGYLYITGRENELIVLSSGKNITPEEVEAHYAQSVFIKELCVLPLQDAKQEKLVAVIVPDINYYRKRGEVNIEGTIKWDIDNYSKTYPSYKRIMGFVLAKEALPRTRLGKLKRHEIKAIYLDELKGKKSISDIVYEYNENELTILASQTWVQLNIIFQTILNSERNIQLNDHLEIDLQIDSLTRIELFSAIEKTFQIKFPAKEIASIFTVKELINTINKLSPKKQTKGFAIQQEAAFDWKTIINKKPQEPVLKKIDLNPGIIAKISAIIFCGTLYVIFKLFWRLKLNGIENLPKDKPFILCANHSSFLDGFLIGTVVPTWLQKKLYIISLRTYLEAPMIKNAIKIARIIPIDTAAQLIDALQASTYILKHNKVVCIFPEGARSIDGKVQPFKKGIGILAQELNIPVIPVYIDGSYQAWPRGKRFPSLYPLSISFGKSQSASSLKKIGYRQNAKDDYDAIAIGLRDTVIQLHTENKQ